MTRLEDTLGRRDETGRGAARGPGRACPLAVRPAVPGSAVRARRCPETAVAQCGRGQGSGALRVSVLLCCRCRSRSSLLAHQWRRAHWRSGTGGGAGRARTERPFAALRPRPRARPLPRCGRPRRTGSRHSPSGMDPGLGLAWPAACVPLGASWAPLWGPRLAPRGRVEAPAGGGVAAAPGGVLSLRCT